MAMASSNEHLQQHSGYGEEANPQKTILITGVSKGLGRALAMELAKRGHIIIGCSRNQNKLDSLQVELSNASPYNHLLLDLDMRSNDSVKEMACIVMEKMGAPDIIVNNAAVYSGNFKIWEVSEEEFDNVIDTNIKGTTNVLRHFIPLMIPENEGVIVNISSIYGRTGAALASAYCASKWAIEGLCKSVAKELPDGMAIVALDPGIINTDMSASHLGNLASQYQSPEQWALKAATMILNLTTIDNGASLTVHDPGVLPWC